MTHHPVCPAYIQPIGWPLNGSQAKWVGEQPEDGVPSLDSYMMNPTSV